MRMGVRVSPARMLSEAKQEQRESGGESPSLHGAERSDVEEDWGHRLTRTGAKPQKIPFLFSKNEPRGEAPKKFEGRKSPCPHSF